MSASPRHTPTNIKAPHGAKAMEITWGDGHVGVLPHRVLRGFCPCAHCQGHGGETRYVPGGNEEILEIEQVGNYAFSLTWGDQHSTGIYTYRYLRALCQCAECAPLTAYRVTP